MVFHWRCFSISYFIQDETSARANTSVDDFYTAHSNFDETQNVAYTSQEYIRRRVVANQNVRPRTLRVFTLAELNAATRNFDVTTKIGEGGFGNVHKGVVKSLEHPFTEISVAVKRGKRGQQGFKQWETEVNVLGEIRHPNLVKLIGYCEENSENESNWLLVYEYMPKGSLDDHLSAESDAPLSWPMRLKIAQDAATGLAYLHEGLDGQIVFRDFKPSNILLDSQWNAKLSDFGFARKGPQGERTHVSTAVVGTKGYAAPEYVQTGRMTSKIDVWSYGIFLEELITGKRPLAQNNAERNPQLLRLVCCYAGPGKSKLIADPRLDGKYSVKSMQKLTLIANKCLAKEPKLRPKMSEVLEMVKEANPYSQQVLGQGTKVEAEDE